MQLRRRRFRNRGWDSTVSAAGPAMNLLTTAAAVTAVWLVPDPMTHLVF